MSDTLDWDLWLGIANFREYTQGGEGYPERSFGGNFYQPFNWRGFYDFGCGALGDMACHILGAPNMALKLGASHLGGMHQEAGAVDLQFQGKHEKFEPRRAASLPPQIAFSGMAGSGEHRKIRRLRAKVSGDLASRRRRRRDLAQPLRRRGVAPGRCSAAEQRTGEQRPTWFRGQRLPLERRSIRLAGIACA